MIASTVQRPQALARAAVAPAQGARRAGGARIAQRRAAATRRVVAFTEEAQEEAQVAAAVVVATAPVTLTLTKKVHWGEHFRVVGALPALGGWEVAAAPEMRWTEGNVWTVTLDLPVDAAAPVDFKLVVVNPHLAPVWEACPNRALPVSGPASLTMDWDASPLAPAEEATAPEAEGPAGIEAIAAVAVEEAAAAEPESKWDWMDSVRAKVGFNPMESDAAPAAPVVPAALAAEAAVETALGPAAPVELSMAASAEAAEAEEAAAEGALLSAVEAVATESKPSSMVNTMMKTAGAVAMGVAAGAVMTALAVDITDVAILGAVAATAAMGAGGATAASGQAGADEEEEEEGSEGGAAAAGKAKLSNGSAPGVVIAAGVLSALDVGRAALRSIDRPFAAPEQEAAEERDEE